jgi:hypothetical protein
MLLRGCVAGTIRSRQSNQGATGMRFVYTCLIALVLSASASGAHAENWRAVDSWFWLDLDSIRQEGAITGYVVAHGAKQDTPPKIDPRKLYEGVNCATGQMFRPASDGSLAPLLDMMDQTAMYMDKSRPLYNIVCGR